MSGKYRALTTNRRSSISVLLVAVLAFTGIVSLSTASNATTPTVSGVSPDSGSAAGGNVITITGQGLTGATAVTIEGVNVAAFTIVSDTQVTATVPTRVPMSRTVGRKDLVVTVGGTASTPVGYAYRPTLIASDDLNASRVVLGDLASRTQAKPITRTTSDGYRVSGTDSNSGLPYTYSTDRDKSDWQALGVRAGYSVEPGWQNEGYESTGTEGEIWPNKESTFSGSIDADAAAEPDLNVPSGYVQLTSYSDCDVSNSESGNARNQVSVGGSPVDAYCSVFGPEVYSEAFYAESGQSVSFNWAAADNGDDYEIYAYLVQVTDATTIPSPSTSNHTLLVHSSGKLQALTTSSSTISNSNLYRFRFVNGTYDATGGYVLGSNMYVNPVVFVDQPNTITMPPVANQVGAGTTQVVTRSTSGEQVIVTASGTSGCTVSSSYSSPDTTVTISWNADGDCILAANQGASGNYSPAPQVTRGFNVSGITPNSITFESIGDADGAGSTTVVVRSSNSSEAVTMTASGTSGCTVSSSFSSPDTTVTITWSQDGTCVVNANQAASGGYAAATQVSRTFTVTGAGTGSGGAGYSPTLTHVSTSPAAPISNTARVSFFGILFDTVTEVYVGGKKGEILSKGPNQLRIKLPGGLSGFVDVEIRSTLGKLSLPRHFNFGGKTNSNRAKLIVGGFEQNSRVLTPRMRAEIERWLAKNSSLKTLTCTGFTSLPRRTTDVALSTNRGITSCNFAKRERPELTPIVKTGIEDPRPGSNIRRVRLVLTP